MTGVKPLKYARNPFVFSDGSLVSTLSELKEKVKVLPESELRKFVNDEKNDFANWVMYSLDNPELAVELKNAKDKDSIITIIEDFEDKTIIENNTFKTFRSESPSLQGNHSNHHIKPAVPEVHSKPSSLKDSHEEHHDSVERLASERIKKSSKAKENFLKKLIESRKNHEGDYHSNNESHKVEDKHFDNNSSKAHGGDSVYSNEHRSSSEHQFSDQEVDLREKHYSSRGIITSENSEKSFLIDDYKMKDNSERVDEAMITEEEAKQYAEIFSRMREEIHKVFIGQDDILQRIQITLLSDAHALLEGVPGLAKSLLVEVLANVISGTTFKRIQFLPDMLPSDVIGGQIYNPRTASFVTIKGPIFANFVLADEINRAPPKTHAALMEAMQEKKINIDKEEFDLDRPFLVLATQNPLENKGTYALPEAVLDRFMFKINLDYPAREHEKIIITENATTRSIIEVRKVNPIISKGEFLLIQKKVKEVHISDKIKDYILDLTEATRGLNKDIEGRQFIKYGAGPRASIYLGIAAKARAVLMGRNFVLPEDIAFVAPDVLRHRIALNFKGKAHNISSDKIIEEILSKVSAL